MTAKETLTKEQTNFLSDYTYFQVENEVNTKLKELRESDEWKEAVEEGKQDEKVLKLVDEHKKYIERDTKLLDIHTQLREIDPNYCIAYNECDYLDEVFPYVPKDKTFEERVEEYKNARAIDYAINKTGFVSSVNKYDLKEVYNEIEARISLEPIANFDNIVDRISSKFEIQDIVNKVVAKRKA